MPVAWTRKWDRWPKGHVLRVKIVHFVRDWGAEEIVISELVSVWRICDVLNQKINSKKWELWHCLFHQILWNSFQTTYHIHQQCRFGHWWKPSSRCDPRLLWEDERPVYPIPNLGDQPNVLQPRRKKQGTTLQQYASFSWIIGSWRQGSRGQYRSTWKNLGKEARRWYKHYVNKGEKQSKLHYFDALTRDLAAVWVDRKAWLNWPYRKDCVWRMTHGRSHKVPLPNYKRYRPLQYTYCI